MSSSSSHVPHKVRSSEAAFVGRTREVGLLEEALHRARASEGSSWLVQGPAGIGKTRLLRTADEKARRDGFRVLWGRCMKETDAAFFPFEQVFRGLSTSPSSTSGPSGDLASIGLPSTWPSTLLVEESKPRRVIDRLVAASATTPTLLLSRERPEATRARTRALPEGASILWLSRVDAPGAVSPLQLDALGERVLQFFHRSPGSTVAIAGLEYLVSQNSFLPVLRLVQFLRDAAEASESHLLLSVAPGALEPRELSLLEAEGEVEREEPESPSSPAGPGVTGTAPTPAQRLLGYLTLLEQQSHTAPILVVLDDLQWVDPMSVRALEFLARNLRPLRVVLVAAVRDDELASRRDEGERTLVDVLDGLEREGALRSLTLGGLSSEESTLLTREVLGPPSLPAEEEGRVVQYLGRMGGNPYYLVETLRQLQDLGQVRRDGARLVLDLPMGSGPSGGTGEELSLPPSIRRLVARRLDRLAAEDRALLEAAAVMGPQFDLTPLASTLREPAPLLVQRAHQLERFHLVRRDPDHPSSWSFGDSLLWDVTLGALPPERLRELSLATASWWSTHRADDVEAIARLYHIAGAPEGAPWIRRAIQAALESRSGAIVERYLRWLVELTPDDPAARETEARDEVGWARKLDSIGYPATARRILQALLARPLVDPVRWSAKSALAGVLSHEDVRQATAVLDELQAEAPSDLSKVAPLLQAHITLTRARLAEVSGRWEEALGLAQAVLSSGAALQEAWDATSAYAVSAWSLKELDRLDEAEELAEKGIAVARARPSSGMLGALFNIQGSILEYRGDLRGACRAFREAVEAARGTGAVSNVIVFLSNLAEAQVLLGEADQARPGIQEALQLANRFALIRASAIARHMWALVLQAEGRQSEARHELEEAAGDYVKVGLSEDLGACHLHLAQAKLALGDSNGAFAELREIDEGRWGSLESRLRPEVERTRGMALLRSREVAQAHAAFDRALGSSRTIGNRYEEAGALAGLAAVAALEERPHDSEQLRSEARRIFTACGVANVDAFLTEPYRT